VEACDIEFDVIFVRSLTGTVLIATHKWVRGTVALDADMSGESVSTAIKGGVHRLHK
jgi:hypothetical protein